MAYSTGNKDGYLGNMSQYGIQLPRPYYNDTVHAQARTVFAVLSFSVNLLLLCYFRPFMKVCEVGLFNTCLALLKALIEVSLKVKLDVAFIIQRIIGLLVT